MVGTTTEFRVLDQSTLFNGEEYLSRLERTGLDLGTIERRKQVIAMYPKAQGGRVQISIGTAHNISGQYTWSPYKSFDPVNDHKVSIRKNGRFFGVRFEGGEPRRISGYDLEMRERGSH